MDIQYGVNVSNKFDITRLNDEVVESVKTKKAAEGDKPKLGTNKQNTKKSTPYTESKGKQNDQSINKKEVQTKDAASLERSNRGGRGNRESRDRDNKENDGERKPFRRTPRDQENKSGDENVPPEFREKPEGSNRFNNRFDDGERGRGRGRSRGGFRGNRGGRGGGGFGQDRGGGGGERSGGFGGGGGGFGVPFESRGKRDFDRHSGSDKTGVKAVDKREGGGRRNWGSFKDDIKNIEESRETNEPTENWNQNEENVEPQETSGEPVPGVPEIVNEEDAQPKQMTLKEYRASQGKNRLRNQFQIRKAGEGVDDSQWNEGRKLKKSVTNPVKPERRIRRNSESAEEGEDSDEDHEDRKKKNKNTLNIEITFNDNNRRGGRGGRRGRGPGRGFYRGNSPRGGSGRGGDRKYREAAPRVDDEKDFPSLVKSAA